MAGVVNHLGALFKQPMVFSSVANPLVTRNIPFQTVLPSTRFWDYRDLPSLNFNTTLYHHVMKVLAGDTPAFIYQRYSLNHFSGVWLARSLNVPLVLEYNGSEVWIAEHWGKPPALGEVSTEIESLNLQSADLIVVVSEVLRNDLQQRGVAIEKILVNANGVDLNQFNPDIDASQLRSELGVDGKTVIGFIGTFGIWHGTEVLVEAFGQIISQRPEWRDKLTLLMIGDGIRRPSTEARTLSLGISDICLFTGSISPLDSPRYLACCDILVAPNVANPDGSAFFGSPTKLFEYMAMGRAIVVSALGQMVEVIDHASTGWLVEPGHPDQLADAVAMLIQDPELRKKLGKSARLQVESKHSWNAHVETIARTLKAKYRW